MAPLELINIYLAGRVERVSGDGHLLSVACVRGQHLHGAGITRDGSRIGRHTIQLIAAAELVGQGRVACAAGRRPGQPSPVRQDRGRSPHRCRGPPR